jgi:hypothetical protein
LSFLVFACGDNAENKENAIVEEEIV